MTDGWDPDRTPVRSPSGALRLGLVPCPSCRSDARADCDFCADDFGVPVRYVPVDAAIEWTVEHGDSETTLVELPKEGQ